MFIFILRSCGFYGGSGTSPESIRWSGSSVVLCGWGTKSNNDSGQTNEKIQCAMYSIY